MCQRDDLRGCEVAFYVHVTRRDPGRTFPGVWRGIPPRTGHLRGHQTPSRREYYRRARSWARERRRNIKELLSGEHAVATGVRKVEWGRGRGGERGERRGPSLTKGLERDWKIASFSKSWMEEIAESVSFTIRFFSRWSNVATGRRIIKEIYSLTCFFVYRSLSGSSSDWGSRGSN